MTADYGTDMDLELAPGADREGAAADDEQWNDASLQICARAHGKADAVQLLKACGLIPDPEASWAPNPGYHQAVKKRLEPP
jgi:hypothetical protein